jgi:CheY-like chemotaxis protein
MNSTLLHLLLADDDDDDRLFFQDALDELGLVDTFTSVHNGEQLMQWLKQETELPTVVFLDLNMPRKNGMECLIEIKQDERLQHLPVIVYSTSFDTDTINLLFKNGALHYIRKPSEFAKLKEVIRLALASIMETVEIQPRKEQFVLQP